ncbi:MAG: hypothetical protein U9N59_15385 [Campylobacterota bacterium]|nr:hypothetical protein [Campylobacterota bacterium]
MINTNIILKQGYKPLILLLVLAVILELFISSFFSNIVLILFLFTLSIYRNPYRHIFENSKSLLSPIDGKIIAIDYTNGKQKIYCKVNLCNNHILRAPQNGDIKIKKYQHGLNLNPNSYKANILNEQIVIKFDNLKLKLISGICNRKIEYVDKEYAKQGENIGLFLDGIAVMTVKKEYLLMVKIGDKLIAGQTIIFKK